MALSVREKQNMVKRSSSSSGPNVNTVEGLQAYAEQIGLNVKAKPKTSLFQKTVDIISRPLYASAGLSKALVKNFNKNPDDNENILIEAWKGLSGKEKETYSDVVAELGVHNKWVKGGVGFALDVALDPTTYFGKYIMKSIGKVAKIGGKVGMSGIKKFSPEVANNLAVTGKSIKDAFGQAFVYAYGGSKVKDSAGNVVRFLGDDIGRGLNKLGMEKEAILKEMVEMFKDLTGDEALAFSEKLIQHRKKITSINKEIKEGKLEEFNKLFAGDKPISGVRNAEKRFGGAKGFEKKFEESAANITERYQKTLDNFTKKLENVKKQREIKLTNRKDLLEYKIGENITEKTTNLTKRLEQVLKDELNLFTGDLLDIQKNLKGGIVKTGLLKGTAKDLIEPTAKEFDEIVKSALGPVRDDMEEAILKLQEEVLDSSGKEFLKKGLGFDNSKEAIAKMIQGKIVNTQNDYNKLVFEMEDKINSQINLMRKKIAEKLGDKKADITSKILKIQNEVSVKKSIAEDFFKSRKTAKETLDNIMPDFTEKELKFFDEKYKPLIDKIAKDVGLPDDIAWKYYYPFIDKTKLNTFGETGGNVFEKTAEGYLKKLEDKIPYANLVKNPIEALTRRQNEILRNTIAGDTMSDAIKTYGASLDDFKKLTDEEFLRKYLREKAEYTLVKERGQYGKEIGALRKRDMQIIDEQLFPDMKVIDMLAKASGYDGLTNFIKVALTAWFPAFHIRNILSGFAQNYETIAGAALNPKRAGEGITLLHGSDKLFFNYKNYKGAAKDLLKQFDEEFYASTRYVGDLSQAIDILNDKSFSLAKVGKLNPRRIGNWIERFQKATMVTTALKKGKTVQEAFDLARKAGFDYTRITPFEAKIMRRVIPFYSFMRFNAELQVKTAIKNPERILNQIKFTQNLSEVFGGGKPTEEDLKGLPNWALSGLGFKVSGNRYLTKFGLPLEEFVGRVNDPLMSTLQSMNPIIKYPLEAKMGYDFFRDKKITDINKIAPETGELLMSDKTPDWLKEIMNVKKSEYLGKVRYTASPTALHKLRNLPTSRLQNTLESLFSKDQESVDKWLAFLTGARVYDIDVELNKYFQEKDLLDDIRQQMLERGDLKEFNRSLIPKSEDE